MQGFSFIHASDLHLDSPFKGVIANSTAIVDYLRAATFEAFDTLVQLCIDEQVQFLVVAGDVYDGADRSLRAQLKFRDGLKTLADHDILSFVAHGNHDPLDGWSSTIEWPEQVHVFGANKVETKTVKKNGEPVASVSGMSYGKRNERRNLAQKYRAANPDLFQIAVLHCNCGGNPNHEAYAPCQLADLTSAKFDYWALGHVHEKRIMSTSPYVVYPGNTQGLSIREQGERGCYIARISEDGHVDIEFHPLDAVRWLSAEIGIDGIGSIDDLERRIAQITDSLIEKAKGRPVICRISLAGRGPLYAELRQETVIPDLLERAQQLGVSEEPFVWVQGIEMNCQPEVDLEKRRDINDLLGQILHVSEEIRDHVLKKGGDSHVLEDALKPALSELYDNRRASRVLEPISPDDLDRIIHEAELLCVDFLEKNE
jgi:DNA repair exonuclease SbcCD nuclease subunit